MLLKSTKISRGLQQSKRKIRGVSQRGNCCCQNNPRRRETELSTAAASVIQWHFYDGHNNTFSWNVTFSFHTMIMKFPPANWKESSQAQRLAQAGKSSFWGKDFELSFWAVKNQHFGQMANALRAAGLPPLVRSPVFGPTTHWHGWHMFRFWFSLEQLNLNTLLALG